MKILNVISVIMIVFGIIYLLGTGGQSLEKKQWGNFKYVVYTDTRYYYTNKIDKEENCIYFTDNYNKETVICEKYNIEDNYWFSNSPSLKTMIWRP